MKTLKEREWFFSQEREPVEVQMPIPEYDIYRLKTTRQVIEDITVDSGLGKAPVTIGATADLHFNFCDMKDREDEELKYTEQCRLWLAHQKSVPAAIAALEAADYCDAAVVLGDVLDYLSNGAKELTKRHIIKKYPDIMMALGGHDYLKQMQTKLPEQLPLETRLDMIREFWPHDIHYYSRRIGESVLAVVIDNSQSKYLQGQAQKLKADMDAAREEGRAVLIFQHEPITPFDPTLGSVLANIANGGAGNSHNFSQSTIVLGVKPTDEATGEVLDLIRTGADVIKGVFTGHLHSQYFVNIKACRIENGKEIPTDIPQYIISGNPYFEAGIVARITVK